MNMILITPDQLKLLIEDTIQSVLLKHLPRPLAEQNELLSVDEAAGLLGIAKQTLYGRTSKRLIPFIKRGGKKILFRRTDLMAYLEEGHKLSISQIENNLIKG